MILIKRHTRAKVMLCMVSALAVICGGGCKAQSISLQRTQRTVLIDRLRQAESNQKTLFGHHDDPVYGHTWKWDNGRSDVLETTGDYPAIMSWDLGGLENGDSLNLDSVPFSRIRSEAIAHNKRGGINTFSWHITTPFGKGTSWTTDGGNIVNEILDNEESRKWFVKAVGNVADFIASLKDENGKPIGVIFRPWHEHTGSWFWWGAEHCTPEKYKELWRLTRAEMDKKGVKDIVWAYSTDRVSDTQQYLERYPGDDMVDVMGCDVYHFDGDAGTDAYRTAATNSLGAAKMAADSHGKIFAFTETGSEGLAATNWYSTVLLPIIRAFHPAYVTVWRNAHDNVKHFYVPYKGHPDIDDFKKFHDDPSIVFTTGQ